MGRAGWPGRSTTRPRDAHDARQHHRLLAAEVEIPVLDLSARRRDRRAVQRRLDDGGPLRHGRRLAEGAARRARLPAAPERAWAGRPGRDRPRRGLLRRASARRGLAHEEQLVHHQMRGHQQPPGSPASPSAPVSRSRSGRRAGRIRPDSTDDTARSAGCPASPPVSTPWRSRASRAYSEQPGTNRHAGGQQRPQHQLVAPDDLGDQPGPRSCACASADARGAAPDSPAAAAHSSTQLGARDRRRRARPGSTTNTSSVRRGHAPVLADTPRARRRRARFRFAAPPSRRLDREARPPRLRTPPQRDEVARRSIRLPSRKTAWNSADAGSARLAAA